MSRGCTRQFNELGIPAERGDCGIDRPARRWHKRYHAITAALERPHEEISADRNAGNIALARASVEKPA